MGLFSRRKQQETDPFGGTGDVPGADPVAAAAASAPVPAAGPVELGGLGGMTGSSTTIDARGVPGLREDVMKLALSGGTSDQILDALRQHGITLPEGVPVTVAPADAAAMLSTARAAGATLPPDGEDAAARMRRLQELRTGDLITEEEFQAQRSRILEEL